MQTLTCCTDPRYSKSMNLILFRFFFSFTAAPTRISYSSRSRDSMTTYTLPKEVLQDDDDDDDLRGIPALDESDEKTPTDGENDVGFDSPNAKDDGGEDTIVVATPDPIGC